MKIQKSNLADAASSAVAEALEGRLLFASGDAHDPTFGTNGQVTGLTNFDTTVAVQSDGKVLVAGSKLDQFINQAGFITRYNSNGSLDTTFGDQGTTYGYLGVPTAIQVQDDGKIMVEGTDGHEIFLSRFGSNGLIERFAHPDGRGYDPGRAPNGGLAIEADDPGTSGYDPTYLTVATSVGLIGPANSVVVRRWKNDGDFANIGATLSLIVAPSGTPVDIQVDHSGAAPAGSFVVLLATPTGAQISRWLSNGTPDTSFGTGGVQNVTFAIDQETTRGFEPAAVVISKTGLYSIVGTVHDPVRGDEAGVIQLTNSGAINTAFATNGYYEGNEEGAQRVTDAVASANDGIIFSESGGATLTMLQPGGQLEPSFGGGGTVYDGQSHVALARVPSSKRVVAVDKVDFTLTRYLEGANTLVTIGSFDTSMSESGQNTGGLIVARSDRLPYATRVFLQASGTATALGSPGGAGNHDFTGFSNSPLSNFVDIPANETFVSLTLTPVDDTRVEGTEFLTMSVLPSDSYDIAEPRAINYALYDNESDETIVDNTRAIFTSGWQPSTATGGYYGSEYVHDNNELKGRKSAQFNGNLASAGFYQVLVRWTADPNRALNVPIDIASSQGTQTVTVNQTKNGGVWNNLGTYQFAAGGGLVTIRTDGTKGYVVADAVRFVKAATPTTITVDNDDALRVKKFGFWSSSTSIGGYLGSDYLHENNRLFGAASIVYDFSGITTGKYEVQARWTANDNRATNAKFDITTATGTISTVRVNQRQNGNAWVSLGLFDLSSLAAITLSNLGADGYVVADGVRIVKVA